MAPFETLLLITASCSLLFAGVFRGIAHFGWCAAICLVASLALHAHYETLRLGMLGVYVIAGGLIIAFVVPKISKVRIPLIVSLICFTALIWTAASATLVPRLLMPAPKGPFLVGTTTPHFGTLEDAGAEYRTPAVKIWYPVDRAAVGWLRAIYERNFGRDGIAEAMVAAVADIKFPLLLYFSGGSGVGMDGMNIVREMVSQGFIVAAVYYPFSLPGMEREKLDKRRSDLERNLFDFSSATTVETSAAAIATRLRERAIDASHVADQIARLSTEAGVLRVRSRLAADQIGVMGFSFGGSIAAEAKKLDPRFKAALNMDGWHFGSSVEGVPWPYLLVLSDEALELYEFAKKNRSNLTDYGATLD